MCIHVCLSVCLYPNAVLSLWRSEKGARMPWIRVAGSYELNWTWVLVRAISVLSWAFSAPQSLPLSRPRWTPLNSIWQRKQDADSESDWPCIFSRQKLTVCPIIDGEEHLRLLNFQHNFITRIQNISNLQRLIFLDLYDNQIEEISGLSTLKSLRVLLLGKNRYL